jgi:hypothetical protein
MIDDDWDDYLSPTMVHGGMYYWLGSVLSAGRRYDVPATVRIGFYPSNGYNRPPNYQHGFNNNTIIVNNRRQQLLNNFNKNSPPLAQTRAKSPITARATEPSGAADAETVKLRLALTLRNRASGRAPGVATRTGPQGLKSIRRRRRLRGPR